MFLRTQLGGFNCVYSYCRSVDLNDSETHYNTIIRWVNNKMQIKKRAAWKRNTCQRSNEPRCGVHIRNENLDPITHRPRFSSPPPSSSSLTSLKKWFLKSNITIILCSLQSRLRNPTTISDYRMDAWTCVPYTCERRSHDGPESLKINFRIINTSFSWPGCRATR